MRFNVEAHVTIRAVSVEAHATHCQMASTIIIVMIRRSNNLIRTMPTAAACGVHRKQIPLKLRAEPARDLLSTYSTDAKSVTSCPPAAKQGRLARYEEMAKFKTRYEYRLYDDTFQYVQYRVFKE